MRLFLLLQMRAMQVIPSVPPEAGSPDVRLTALEQGAINHAHRALSSSEAGTLSPPPLGGGKVRSGIRADGSGRDACARPRV